MNKILKLSVFCVILFLSIHSDINAEERRALFSPLPKEIKDKLTEAKKLYPIEPLKAVSIYWEIYNLSESDMTIETKPGLNIGLKSFCLDIFKTLKSDEKKHYQELAESEASKLFNYALGKNDYNVFKIITSSFPGTKEAAKAYLLLGYIYKDFGCYGVSRRYFLDALDNGELEKKEKDDINNNIREINDKAFIPSSDALEIPLFLNWFKNMNSDFMIQYNKYNSIVNIYDGKNMKEYDIETGESIENINVPLVTANNYDNDRNTSSGIMRGRRIVQSEDGNMKIEIFSRTDNNDVNITINGFSGGSVINEKHRVLSFKLGKYDNKVTLIKRNEILMNEFEKFLINTSQAGPLIDVRGTYLWSLYMYEPGHSAFNYIFSEKAEKLSIVEPFGITKNSPIVYTIKVVPKMLSYNYYLQAYDRSSCSFLWENWIGAESRKPPHRIFVSVDIKYTFAEPYFMCDDDILYGILSNGTIAAIDSNTGNILWIRSLTFKERTGFKREENEYYCPFAVSKEILYCTSPFSSDIFLALDKHSGEILWEKKGSNIIFIGCDENIYLIDGNILYSFDEKTKEEKSKYIISGQMSGIGTADDKYIYLPVGKSVYILDKKNCDLKQVFLRENGAYDQCKLEVCKDKLVILSKSAIEVWGKNKEPENQEEEEEKEENDQENK